MSIAYKPTIKVRLFHEHCWRRRQREDKYDEQGIYWKKIASQTVIPIRNTYALDAQNRMISSRSGLMKAYVTTMYTVVLL
jgi:hypothetical protein